MMDVIGFIDETNATILIVLEGVQIFVPNDLGNRHRQLIAEWEAKGNTIPPFRQSLEDQWQALRIERDRRLTASDPYLAPDRDVDQTAWIAYRQQLRDLPETVSDPAKVVWPEPPAEKGLVT